MKRRFIVATVLVPNSIGVAFANPSSPNGGDGGDGGLWTLDNMKWCRY
ncbi:MAG: hypothetical protein WBL44_03435 [Nitrososphaeraceae archaeon]